MSFSVWCGDKSSVFTVTHPCSCFGCVFGLFALYTDLDPTGLNGAFGRGGSMESSLRFRVFQKDSHDSRVL